jgi:hypothetical protein
MLANTDVKSQIISIVNKGNDGQVCDFRRALKTVTVSDFHIPFVDDAAFNVFINFINDYQPDELILNGNMVDMYSFSTHPRKKALIEALVNGAKERDLWLPYAQRMRDACPDAAIKYIGSSCHEGWLDNWAEQDSIISQDENYTLPGFLKFKDFGIEYYPEKYEKKHFMWVHGSAVSGISGMSARAELEYYGKSGCSGHTHRLAAFYKTTADGPVVWFEVGCMCFRESWYKVKGKKLINWQQGFLINEFHGESFSPHLVALIRDDADKPYFAINGVIYK